MCRQLALQLWLVYKKFCPPTRLNRLLFYWFGVLKLFNPTCVYILGAFIMYSLLLSYDIFVIVFGLWSWSKILSLSIDLILTLERSSYVFCSNLFRWLKLLKSTFSSLLYLLIINEVFLLVFNFRLWWSHLDIELS